MDLEQSEAGAAGFYRGLEVVAGYMESVSGLVQGVTVLPRQATRHRDESLSGLWYRSWGWVQSLKLLNSTKHVQAHLAGNRALLEITTDMILLHRDPTNKSGWMYVQWGQSEKWKTAEQTLNFYAGQGIPIPEIHEDTEKFYKDYAASVADTRRNLWPDKKDSSKGIHPARWTGRSDLFRDVEEADRVYGAEIKVDLGVSLTEYYRTEYRRMNWLIHSGAPGWWNIEAPGISIMSGLSLRASATLAMLCTKVMLLDAGYNHAIEDLRRQWEKVNDDRNWVFFNPELPGE
jgi:hypothetical protein